MSATTASMFAAIAATNAANSSNVSASGTEEVPLFVAVTMWIAIGFLGFLIIQMSEYDPSYGTESETIGQKLFNLLVVAMGPYGLVVGILVAIYRYLKY